MLDLKQVIKPGRIIVRRCGKIELIIKVDEDCATSIDVETFEVNQIFQEFASEGKHSDSHHLDIVEVMDSKIDYIKEKTYWTISDSKAKHFQEVLNVFINRNIDIYGVKETIEFLGAAGISKDDLVYIFGFDGDDVEEFLEDE